MVCLKDYFKTNSEEFLRVKYQKQASIFGKTFAKYLNFPLNKLALLVAATFLPQYNRKNTFLRNPIKCLTKTMLTISFRISVHSFSIQSVETKLRIAGEKKYI